MNSKDISRKFIWALVMIVTFLGHFVGISPIIEERYGVYFRGLLDGVFATLMLCAVIFYVSSFFEVSKPAQDTEKTSKQMTRSTQENTSIQKVDLKLVQEIIKRLDNVVRIFNQVVERGGRFDPFAGFLGTILLDEETEFKQNIDWLAENYPPIAGETSKAMRHIYVDQIRGIRVNNYDPTLQIIQHNSLKSIFEQGDFFSREFNKNLTASRARLLAYSGFLKKKN